MSLDMILLLIKIVLCILAFLYGFVIVTKLMQVRKRKLSKLYRQSTEGALTRLLYDDSLQFKEEARSFILRNRGMMKKSIYREVIEDILIRCIEKNEEKPTLRALLIAYGFGLPAKCLDQIKSNHTANIASGCQKAGLYRYARAIPNMIDALDVFSSDTQMEILRALSIIGDLSAIEAAFDKIKNMLLINERYVFELILSFAGDRELFCSHMVTHSSDYVSSLFLKAIGRGDVFALKDEIVKIAHEKNKEKRIAAMKALGKMNDKMLGGLYIDALSDPNWEVRAVSAKILGDIIVPQAGESLAAATCDREWWVRQNAADSLLRYPQYEDLFITILETKDKYAYESIFYALGNSRDGNLADEILRVADVWGLIC